MYLCEGSVWVLCGCVFVCGMFVGVCGCVFGVCLFVCVYLSF